MTLDLRPMTVADADELFEVLSDPRLWEYDPTRVHVDVEQTRSYAGRAADRWRDDGLSYWVVRLVDTGELIGSGGAQLHPRGHWNLNYRIAVGHQRHGHAGHVLATALVAAHDVDPGRPCIAWIDETNPASARVAERGGLTCYGLRLVAFDDVPRLAYADRALDDAVYPPA